MFDLAVSDIETSEIAIKKWATKAIGLIDPEQKDAIPAHENYLQLYFHDCDEAEHPDYYAVSPEKHHIKKILAFSQSFTDEDRVLVHCHAGISRSSAVAIAISVQHGLDPFEAFYNTERVCPEMYPNKLILRYADDLLGKNNSLINYHDIWLRNFRREEVRIKG